jgi:MinD superfamily P-loop ATPase
MIVSIASGKGGTGKTLVATSLAFSLQDTEEVQLLDCDVEEPNDHLFLKPSITNKEAVCIPVPKVDASKCTYCGECARVCAYKAIAVLAKHVMVFDQLCHGCGACSYLCPEHAIYEEGREVGVVESGYAGKIEFVQGKLTVGESMATPVIRKVKERINRHKTVIVDVSPGTSCPVVESIKDTDFCLLVTEPTPFGLNDLILAVETTIELGIPRGIIINRSGMGMDIIEDYCRQQRIPVLLNIPLDIEVARLYSGGVTLAQGMPRWKSEFYKVFAKIKELAGERDSCPQR